MVLTSSDNKLSRTANPAELLVFQLNIEKLSTNSYSKGKLSNLSMPSYTGKFVCNVRIYGDILTYLGE